MAGRGSAAPPRAGGRSLRLALPALAALALAAATASAADAGETGGAALHNEVKALEAKVRELEHRVELLEGHSSPAPAAAAAPAPARPPAPPATHAPPATPAVPVPRASTPAAGAGYVSPEAALRASWSKIGEGMDAREVETLLGPPSKKLVLNGRTVWYYDYPGTGAGSVFFTDAGRVSSRQSPFGWGW